MFIMHYESSDEKLNLSPVECANIHDKSLQLPVLSVDPNIFITR